jgi:hypothetical protein
MEALTRLVSESFARYGFDRPLDYRRLHWSRWFPCESPHSLLFVPSKPGIFALAEEVMNFGSTPVNVGTAALGCPAERSSLPGDSDAGRKNPAHGNNREGHDFSSEPALRERSESKAAAMPARTSTALANAEGIRITSGGQRVETPRRMLAVLQFCEDDDMAFVLDRMFSRENPMRARLASGRCFVRFVVLEDPAQRRSICNALNQWLISSSETSTGIGAHFATSLELTDSSVARAPSPATADTTNTHVATGASPACPEPSRRAPRSEASGPGSEPDFSVSAASQLDSGAAANLHCPSPFPSGF